jgi:hypothetical protein
MVVRPRVLRIGALQHMECRRIGVGDRFSVAVDRSTVLREQVVVVVRDDREMRRVVADRPVKLVDVIPVLAKPPRSSTAKVVASAAGIGWPSK